MTDVKHRGGKLREEGPVDVSAWLDRLEVADLLKVSVHTLANWGRKGILNPIKIVRPDSAGMMRMHWVYDPKEVAKVSSRERNAAKDPGEIAARCFDLLDHGKSIKDIVIELRELPEKIEVLFDQWMNSGGANFVISPLAREELEQLIGKFSNIAELVENVKKCLKLDQP